MYYHVVLLRVPYGLTERWAPQQADVDTLLVKFVEMFRDTLLLIPFGTSNRFLLHERSKLKIETVNERSK
jgi:hypothetical protein